MHPVDQPSERERASIRVLGALALVTLFTVVTRVWGLDFLLPHRPEPDREIAQQVAALASHDPEALTTSVMSKYPWLVARLAALGFELPDWRDPTPRTAEEHAERCAALSIRARWVVAIFGIFAVPATWLAARAFFAPRDALLAASIVAASLLHQSFSQQARPHVPAATLTLVAVASAALYARSGRWRDWIVASAAAALAFGALHSGIAAFLALGAAALLRVRAERVAIVPKLLVLAAAGAISVLVFYPFLVDREIGNATATFDVTDPDQRQGHHAVDLASFTGGGFAAIARAMWFFEPVLGVAVVLGAIAALAAAPWSARARAARRGSLLVVLAYAIPYLLVIGAFERTYQRFLVPLLPFGALVAVRGWTVLRERVGARSPRAARAAAVLGWVLVVGLPGATVARHAWLRAQPDTYELLARWITEHLDPARHRVGCLPPLYLPPLLQTDDTLTALAPSDDPARLVYWHVYQSLVPAEAKRDVRWHLRVLQFSAAEAEAIRASQREFVRSIPERFLALVDEERPPRIERRRTFEATLRDMGWRVARFGPDDIALPLEYQERQRGPWRPSYALRLWTARAIGPVIELLQLPD